MAAAPTPAIELVQAGSKEPNPELTKAVAAACLSWSCASIHPDLRATSPRYRPPPPLVIK